MAGVVSLQEYIVTSVYVSENSDDFSERFSRIVVAALHRASKAINFFEDQAKRSTDVAKSSFLRRMADKKMAHYSIIEKIHQNYQYQVVIQHMDAPAAPQSFNATAGCASAAEALQDMFGLVYEKSIDELDFYLNFLLIETHPIITSLLFTLANLSKDFLFEVKIRFLEHQAGKAESGFPKIHTHSPALSALCN